MPVGYIYDTSEPVSKMALSNQSCTITSKDWGDLNPIVEPHRGQTQIALYNSIYVNLELMAPMPRWVNLSDDQKLRIVAPIVGLMAGGQLHLACDISVVRLPANDWQIASGFSTKSVRYSEISMTDIESIKTSFIELTGHPVVAEYEDKPLNLMRDWAKGLWKVDEYPTNPYFNLMQDRVTRRPRAISLHVQSPEHPHHYHTQEQMLSMPLEDYRNEFQHIQDILRPWESRTSTHGDDTTDIQATMLTNQDAIPPPPT